MQVLGYSLVRSVVRSHLSLVRLLRVARSAPTLRCAHSHARSLARSRASGSVKYFCPIVLNGFASVHLLTMFSASAAEDGDGDDQADDDEAGAGADSRDGLQRHERRRGQRHQRRFHAHFVDDAAIVGAVILGPETAGRRQRKQTRFHDFPAEDLIALNQL